jgi:hypothetical protein
METLKYIITADKTRFMVLMLKQSGNHDNGNPPTFFALTERNHAEQSGK